MRSTQRFAAVMTACCLLAGCGTTGVQVLPDHDRKYKRMAEIRRSFLERGETVADLFGPGDAKPKTGPDAKPAPKPAPGAEKVIVAVFDIHDASRRFKRESIAQLTDYLSTKLTEYCGYRIIPRSQLRARLVETKKESYKECYDQKCQIELGRSLAAQKSLSTKILGVGSRCAVTAVLFDLKTETTEKAASVDTDCNREEDLMSAMETIARKLAGGS